MISCPKFMVFIGYASFWLSGIIQIALGPKLSTRSEN